MGNRTDEAGKASSPVVMRNWAFGQVGSLVILCTRGDGPPSEHELDAWIDRIRRDDFTAILIHAEAGDVTAKQRARIRQAMEPPRQTGTPLVALMTDSVIPRLVMTGLSWFNPRSSKAVRLSELRVALTFLRCDEDFEAVARAIQAMRTALGAVP